ncbi:hypothetical protein QQZ08_007590 [Neonectria magnoliae]|uniref:Aminoglycoside phosphotransferase domain-containing protein n=1 Tax=Neonectria magnoliae TaxID=2732573 RepID=A0ABR1HXR5_9HYPO
MMEDVVSSDRLRDAARNLSPLQATNVGEALGKWLAGFHHWSSSQLDAGLLEMLESNGMIDDLIHEGLDDKIFAHCESVEIRDMAWKQLMTTDTEGRGVVYGDLTTKNILIQTKSGSDRMNVTPIDWEACRLGMLMQDVALLIADLFVQYSLEASPAALPLIHGFIRGYGPVKDTLVFQAAVYTGIYLFLWEGGGPYTYEADQVDGLLQVAVNLVAHGAGEDREAIKETFMGGLFS